MCLQVQFVLITAGAIHIAGGARSTVQRKGAEMQVAQVKMGKHLGNEG